MLWQVGDTSEQNGSFKQRCYEENAELITAKFDLHLPCTITPTDIMPLLTKFLPAYDILDDDKAQLQTKAGIHLIVSWLSLTSKHGKIIVYSEKNMS